MPQCSGLTGHSFAHVRIECDHFLIPTVLGFQGVLASHMREFVAPPWVTLKPWCAASNLPPIGELMAFPPGLNQKFLWRAAGSMHASSLLRKRWESRIATGHVLFGRVAPTCLDTGRTRRIHHPFWTTSVLMFSEPEHEISDALCKISPAPGGCGLCGPNRVYPVVKGNTNKKNLRCGLRKHSSKHLATY